jgi:hypothetical protein
MSCQLPAAPESVTAGNSSFSKPEELRLGNQRARSPRILFPTAVGRVYFNEQQRRGLFGQTRRPEVARRRRFRRGDQTDAGQGGAWSPGFYVAGGSDVRESGDYPSTVTDQNILL